VLVDDVQTTLFKFVDDQSTRKSMKSVSIMIVQEIIVMSNAKHFNKILLEWECKNQRDQLSLCDCSRHNVDQQWSFDFVTCKEKIDALLRRIQCAYSINRQLKAKACFRNDVLCFKQKWNVKYNSRIVRIKTNWDEIELLNVYLTLWFFKANFENIINKRFREENQSSQFYIRCDDTIV
jgi:hypothetical protein